MHQMFISHTSQNRINILAVMGEATGDAEEGDDFAIQGKLRQQRQAENGDGVPSTCPAATAAL